MPEAFNKCVADGGKVFTKKLPEGQYIHGCKLGKKAVWGEIHKTVQTKKK